MVSEKTQAMRRIFTLAAVLFLTTCEQSSDVPVDGGDHVNGRQFASIPGSMTTLLITIFEAEGVNPDDKVYELMIDGLSGSYSGPAYLDEYWIGLFQFEADSVDLRCNQDKIYHREDLPIQDAYRQGWCVAELGADGFFLHGESIQRFVDAMKAEEDNQTNNVTEGSARK